MELGRELSDVERRVREYVNSYHNGDISEKDMLARISDISALDAESNAWSMNADLTWVVTEPGGTRHDRVSPSAFLPLEKKLSAQVKRQERGVSKPAKGEYYQGIELFWPRLFSIVYGVLATLAALLSAFALATADPSILAGTGLPPDAQLAVAVAGLAVAAIPALIVALTLLGNYRLVAVLTLPLVLCTLVGFAWALDQQLWIACVALLLLATSSCWSAAVMLRVRGSRTSIVIGVLIWVFCATVATVALTIGAHGAHGAGPAGQVKVKESGVESTDFFQGRAVGSERERAQLLADLIAADSAAQGIAATRGEYVMSPSMRAQLPQGAGVASLTDASASASVQLGACEIQLSEQAGGANQVRCP